MTTIPVLGDVRAALPAYPIEVQFPELSRWRKGNVGIDYIHSFDSGAKGPHVMLLSLIHGNEVCGALALDAILAAGLRPVAGRLSLGFANVAAYERFDSASADASRFVEEDMNRVWDRGKLEGPGSTTELDRAREIRPFIDTVDLLLDLHSMHEASEPLMMCGPLEKGLDLARALGHPEHVVIDAGHSSGVRLRDYGHFGIPASPRNALLLEAGQHFSKESAQISIDIACEFLVLTGVVRASDVEPLKRRRSRVRQRFIEITHPIVAESMEFSFALPLKGLDVIRSAGTTIAYDRKRPIVTPYDECVVIQPSLRHLSPGSTMMRLGRLVDADRVSANPAIDT